MGIRCVAACAAVVVSSIAQASFNTELHPYSILGRTIDGVKVVRDLPKQNALAAMGVKKGDIVLGFNDQRIHNREAALQAYLANELRDVLILRNHHQMLLRRKQ
jgi:S1-C subfamily serine protease